MCFLSATYNHRLASGGCVRPETTGSSGKLWPTTPGAAPLACLLFPAFDRVVCSGLGHRAIGTDHYAGIDVALVVSFENPPAPTHPAASGVFSQSISGVAPERIHWMNMARVPSNNQDKPIPGALSLRLILCRVGSVPKD
jgi:hypothetical protein